MTCNRNFSDLQVIYKIMDGNSRHFSILIRNSRNMGCVQWDMGKNQYWENKVHGPRSTVECGLWTIFIILLICVNRNISLTCMDR